ncbi:MAG: AIR synthase related protein, partial [Balneolaceae bacterium]
NSVNARGASDSGVVRIKGTKKGLAVKTDCNGRYVYLNPRRGGQIAVAEAARNVVCSGAKPMAITNCLNFGNPYKPDVYWTFKEALGGMGDACRIFDTPVTGGNVSFYNENPKGAIFPTPVIGMLGLIDDVYEQTMTPGFKEQGDVVYYIGANRSGLGGSEYLRVIHGLTTGDAPALDLEFEAHLQKVLLQAIREKRINAAHDVSDGGLAVTLAEMAIFSGIGAAVSIKELSGSYYDVLYSEAQSGVVITVSQDQAGSFESFCKRQKLPAQVLGVVGGKHLEINEFVKIPVSSLSEIYESVIPAAMSV